jgi:integrase
MLMRGDRDLELDFIREFAVSGELLKGSSDDRRERIRVAIYRCNLLREPFRDSGMDYGQPYQRCYGRPIEMRRTVRHEPKSEPLIAAESLQLLTVAYSTMARRSELVALTTDEIKFNPHTGDGVAIIRMTKVSREEARHLVPEAVKPLRTWLSHAGISTGAIFRRFESRRTVGHRSIHPQEVARIIQRVGRLLNAQHTGTEPVWPYRASRRALDADRRDARPRSQWHRFDEHHAFGRLD